MLQCLDGVVAAFSKARVLGRGEVGEVVCAVDHELDAFTDVGSDIATAFNVVYYLVGS